MRWFNRNRETKTVELTVSDMRCAHCEASAKLALGSVNGVVGVKVNRRQKRVMVTLDSKHPVRGLREVYRALKPGGIFSTTEEFLDPDYPRRKTTMAWAEAAGFELDERFGNVVVYTLNFRKPA